jgi:hypothetical protein
MRSARLIGRMIRIAAKIIGFAVMSSAQDTIGIVVLNHLVA